MIQSWKYLLNGNHSFKQQLWIVWHHFIFFNLIFANVKSDAGDDIDLVFAVVPHPVQPAQIHQCTIQTDMQMSQHSIYSTSLSVPILKLVFYIQQKGSYEFKLKLSW